ncbi:MAG: hypothetical protein ACTSU9_00705, partial [Promethearchaeota archaeon]
MACNEGKTYTQIVDALDVSKTMVVGNTKIILHAILKKLPAITCTPLNEGHSISDAVKSNCTNQITFETHESPWKISRIREEINHSTFQC